MATTTLDFLRTRLRLHIGDMDSETYLDEWLDLALILSVESLGPWWNFKYLLNDSDEVYRNSTIRFLFSEPPVIERADHKPIILMASIILKAGDLQNASWNIASWRDAEISYSNIQGSRIKDSLLVGDWEELTNILKPPQKRLSAPGKKHLQGFEQNPYERGKSEEDS